MNAVTAGMIEQYPVQGCYLYLYMHRYCVDLAQLSELTSFQMEGADDDHAVDDDNDCVDQGDDSRCDQSHYRDYQKWI